MLTDEDVAKLLGTSPWVVQKMARNKQLPGARKIGRKWMFRRNEIQRHVEGEAARAR